MVPYLCHYDAAVALRPKILTALSALAVAVAAAAAAAAAAGLPAELAAVAHLRRWVELLLLRDTLDGVGAMSWECHAELLAPARTQTNQRLQCP